MGSLRRKIASQVDSQTWTEPTGTIALQPDEVHAWRTPLKLDSQGLQSIEHALSPDEQERALRFRVPRARRQFVSARAWLRLILARYTNMQPSEVEITYGQYGKPQLGPAPEPASLRFNVSHSGDFAIIAVAQQREVGVDVERIRPQVAVEALADSSFSTEEAAGLKELRGRARQRAFFTCWSRKEAYAKATGKGLRLPLAEFEVSVAPWEPAALIGTSWDSQEASRWTLKDMYPAPGYVAAIAVEGSDWQLRRWRATDWDRFR